MAHDIVRKIARATFTVGFRLTVDAPCGCGGADATRAEISPAIPAIAALLRCPDADTQRHAAGALKNLAVSGARVEGIS